MAAFPSFPWLARRESVAWCRTGLARDPSLQAAVDELARQLAGAGPADLALVFASASYASDLPRLLPLLRQKLQARHWIGCLGGILGGVLDAVWLVSWLA
jgi:small ligand-binding sensory domain FIST